MQEYRKVTKILLGLVIAGLFFGGGCGREKTGQGDKEEAVRTGAVSGLNDQGKEGASLTVLNYGEYIDRSVLTSFEKETGIRVLYEEATTPEEMYAKYKAGAIRYDLVCTSDYMLEKLINERELQTINWDEMEYEKSIGDIYWKLSESYDPGNHYTVPYFWGTVGLLYNDKLVRGKIDGWDDVFDGSYQGEIIMPNSIRDAYMCALKYLGYSLNTRNKKELEEAQKLLIRQKPDVEAYFVDEVREEMLAGNAAIAVCYSGEAAQAKEYDSNLHYVLPKEGSNLWIDGWGITRKCSNKKGAEKFLDYLLRVDIARKNFDEIYYPTPNESLFATLDKEKQEDEVLNPPKEALEKCEVYKTLDPKTTEVYSELWKCFKVS